ncbi:MAG: polyprenyl synthetase family protein [Firmicutes bacterium]|nr:polyprenyl synthetase family protein [Bacillota bacterium]
MKNPQYQELKALAQEHLLDFLPEIDPKSSTLYEAMKYSLLAGGKMLRSVLVLASCRFAGGDVISALPYACAMEYIHTYSLIHDDLPALDNDDLRRGRPTNHKVFGEDMAILAGDGLLSCAFEAMNKDKLLYLDDLSKLKPRVLAAYEISKGAGCRGMVAGQVADVEVENRPCSKELLDYIHINKTAAMIMAAIRAGACLGGADSKMLNDLTSYGEAIGLAFQIKDDILDVMGDEALLGKPIGSDAEQGKPTYPILHGMDASMARLTELTERAIALMEPYGEKGEFFRELAEYLAIRNL